MSDRDIVKVMNTASMRELRRQGEIAALGPMTVSGVNFDQWQAALLEAIRSAGYELVYDWIDDDRLTREEVIQRFSECQAVELVRVPWRKRPKWAWDALRGLPITTGVP